MTTTTSEAKIICHTCAASLPATEFRRRSKDSDARITKCRRCHAGYERTRRQKIQQKRNGLAVQKAATEISRYRNIDRIQNLIELMVTRFGGPAGFYDFWTAEIHRVKSQKRATKRVLRFCEMILSAHLAESRGNNFNVEDSRAAALQTLRLLFQQEPGLVSAAAREAGVTVMWAENIQASA